MHNAAHAYDRTIFVGVEAIMLIYVEKGMEGGSRLWKRAIEYHVNGMPGVRPNVYTAKRSCFTPHCV